MTTIDDSSRICMTIDMDEADNAVVLSFPGKKKEVAEDGPYLQIASGYQAGACNHNVGFVFDEKLEHVLCKGCGEKVSPMWVLLQMARQETRWHRAREAYQEEMKRLSERSRTKCRHCGEMTPISRG